MTTTMDRRGVDLNASDSDENDRPLPAQNKRRVNRAIVDSDSDSDVIEIIQPIKDRNKQTQMPGAFPSPSGPKNSVSSSNRVGDQASARQPAPITMPAPQPSNSTKSGSTFVGGFAPYINPTTQTYPTVTFPTPSGGNNYWPPPKTFKPPAYPPPKVISQVHPNGRLGYQTPAPVRVPQEGSADTLINSLAKVNLGASNKSHGHTPSASSLHLPRQEGEFDLENVNAAPGEVVADWDELITNIKATADEVAEAFDEKDTIVPGFADGIVLRPWQVHGRRWMLSREEGKKRGGILADDMGLGKTVQMITLITLNPRTQVDRDKGYARGTLIVVGLNILGQWEKEIKKFNPSLKVLAHHGPSRTKSKYELEKYHVVLTTYDVLSNEHAAYEDPIGAASSGRGKSKEPLSPAAGDSDSDDGFGGSLKARKEKLLQQTSKGKKVKEKAAPLFEVDWLRVVIDEAQNIKNRNSKRSLAASALDSKYRWALTGTPIQNNVEDLFSLLRFLQTKPLHSWDQFNEKIRKPIMAGRTATPMKRLHLILSTIMLRRIKAEIAELNLPDRNVHIKKCEFEEAEQFVYEQLRTIAEEKIDKAIEERDMMSALVLLLRLRQACDHPTLTKLSSEEELKSMNPNPKADDETDDLTSLMKSMSVKGHCETCHAVLSNSEDTFCRTCAAVNRQTERKASDVRYRSTKIRKILKILRKIEKSPDTGKTIIFSEFVKMLDIIAGVLDEESIRYVRYDGSMNAAQRQISLDAIKDNSRIKVILISTKAGNSGLNLTCCSNVIMVDPWWNPAIEDQAFDRAHRLGQTRNVEIYKLMIPDTVEERILELQDKKRALAKAALEGGKLSKQNNLTFHELLNLFRHGHHEEEDE
ncbi:hypothetical protein CPB86DRAFT_753986 [Serendipita vermifera]|nr:hypothetical protein CPB86DRAFT_753986 [Serendipita vermifera]